MSDKQKYELKKMREAQKLVNKLSHLVLLAGSIVLLLIWAIRGG